VAAFLGASRPLCAWLEANVGVPTARLARR